ncbi:MAG TPA: exodeoxyribonuclease VII small subunit, partial [Lactobacillus acetotolerans]|nr:exodeoxyribonuclease VII small subunit [Lactobacillus acetotolerans]
MATKKNNFEEQLNDLQKIVTNLENGNVPLEDALKEFQEGVTISRNLNKKLTQAEETVAKLVDSDGTEHKL